ncbi:hypothetical protein MSAN_01200900 [Mycena sanguinolenta]|uniref:Rhodopsin domain-containing protein n=1 Tax=Mycena sanguinolenta TaxID=230812 RepID=A0A8H6YGC1_9AGAR|nr:hypothetical protein MSAN_01200900 [Mycena sanguinolenta]
MLSCTSKLLLLYAAFFALAATGYRLYKRRHKLWADDVCALFAASALVIQVVAVFLHIPPPNPLSHTSRIAVYYLTAITLYLIVWASRLSILFSVIRIESYAARRKLLFCAAALFSITALLLVAQVFWVCESRARSSWKSRPDPECGLPRQVAIFQFVADVTSDAILLFAPWPLFRSLVDKSLARKLTVIFSVSVATTILSIVHANFILVDDDDRMPFSGIVEACLSLIVANIPVIITATIDILGQPEPGVTAEFSTIFWLGTNGTVQLQTVGQHRPHDVTLPPAESTGDLESSSNSQKGEQSFDPTHTIPSHNSIIPYS